MERYSTLYGAHTFVNANGKEMNEYIEISRSANLDDFLRKHNIPNPTMAIQDVNAALTGFVKLPGYDEQPADCYPMLVRYAPMHLKRLSTYDSNVISFNSIACSAPDHQVGNRDGKYRNTHYIDRSLLMNVGEYNFLDQIFGTHLVTWQENASVREFPIDHDVLPAKVQPSRNGKDAIVVQMAAAALCNKCAVILKLEKGCTFQLRAMELLKQIYALFAPLQAAEIGFASYEDPARIPQLIADTMIRLFVVPAEVETGALEKQSNMLVLDLNKRIEKPSANDLLRAVSVWYGTPWKDRVRIMSALFGDMVDPTDSYTYVERSRKYKEASSLMEQELKGKRAAIETLEELKKFYERFGSLMDIPVMHERFCSAAPRLMKLPKQYAEKAKNVREQRYQLGQWITSELVNLGADVTMEKKGGSSEASEKEKLYRFCCDMFKINVDLKVSHEVGRRTVELTTDAVTEKKEREFASECAAIAAERAEFGNQLKNAVDTEKAKGQAAVEAEKANTQRVQAALDQANIEKQIAVDAEKARGQAAVEAEKANTQRVQGELNQAIADRQKAIDEEQARGQAALEAEKARGRAALNAEKANTQRIQGELSQMSADMEAQSAELTKAKTAAAKRKQKIAELESENEQLNKLLNTRGIAKPVVTILGVDLTKDVIKIIAIASVLTFLVGSILSGVIVGLLSGGKSDPPIPATTAPIVETTAPAVETTVPVETTKATEPETLLVDGEINWDYVYKNMNDVVKLEHESAQIEALLNEMNITSEGYAGELEAVLSFSNGNGVVFLTVQRTPAERILGADDTAEPATSEDSAEELAEETAEEPTEETAEEPTEETTEEPVEETTEETVAETEPEIRLLAEMVPSFVMDNGTYRFEVFSDSKGQNWAKAVAVAEELFRELTEDVAAVTITVVDEDDVTVDLHGLMADVSMNETWWEQSFKLDLNEDSRYTKQKELDTSKMPVMMILFEDGTEALLYDYTKDSGKREEMVGVLNGKGYDGAYNETMVIGLTAQQDATDVPPETESSDTAQSAAEQSVPEQDQENP